MRLALIQFNPTVGDIAANASAIQDRIALARPQKPDLIVFPELALTGYPPRDLLNQEGFCRAARDAALEIASGLRGPTVVIGTPWRPPAPGGVISREPDAYDDRGPITNSLLVLHAGRIADRYDKRLLPTYDVFDEHRYFTPGARPVIIDAGGLPVGLSICEDLWKSDDAGPAVAAFERYHRDPDPVADLVEAGARLILNPSASPFVLGKRGRQRDILISHVESHDIALATINQLGGNDDLVFDGHGYVYVPTASGAARLVAAATPFSEDILFFDIPSDPTEWDALPEADDPTRDTEDPADLFRALTLGVRDYVRKTGFSRVLIGLSGGIDSAVTAAIAAAALGPANVLGVAMPSRFSSDHSVTDAEALARMLGTKYIEIPIESPHAATEELLTPAFASLGLPAEHGVTEENVQARLRGLILMSLSNKSGAILLTTGNKSELAVGYCTLYGDMNGGLAVLSDVSKIDVYRLARWINDHPDEAGFPAPPIPEDTITKPPSAELRPDQLDSDSLPPYEQLDQIIERYVERQQHPRRIVEETGIDAALVARIVRLIDINEYKRKQMPIGLKVSSIAFGRGRRRPIAQNYRPDQYL